MKTISVHRQIKNKESANEMSISEIIMLSGLVVANGGAIAVVFINLNIKVTECMTNLTSLRNDIEEHKLQNKDDIKEIKEIVNRDRHENRDDHNRLLSEFNAINKNINDFKMDLIKIIKQK